MIINNITELVGNTPLLKLPKSLHGLEHIELYAKLELFNPWGSIKDRTAIGMVQPHLENLSTHKLIETSSGNTAKALQMLALMHGTSLKTITNRIKLPEVREILQLLGAEIQELPGKSDCYDPTDPNDPVMYIQRELAAHPDQFIYTDQYRNPNNTKIHEETTGNEILKDLEKVDYLIASLGTTGSSLGVSTALKSKNPDLETIGVVAESEDYIPGIRTQSEVMEVGLFDPKWYTHIIPVNSSSALETMRELIQQSGVLAGPTSGATLNGALTYLREQDKKLNESRTAVMIVCDRVEWYMSYIKQRRAEWFGYEQPANWQDETIPSNEFDISVSDATDWIAEQKPLIVDLRQPISYKTGHIPHSINFSFDQLDETLNSANPFCTNQTLLFVCSIGERSRLVATHLSKKGISAFSLEDGLTGWRKAGLAIESNL